MKSYTQLLGILEIDKAPFSTVLACREEPRALEKPKVALIEKVVVCLQPGRNRLRQTED